MQDKAPRPRKKAVNPSIDAELAAEAKAAGANLSALLERALRAGLSAHRAARWRAENSEAIKTVNRYVADNGLPLAKFRTW